MTAFITPVSKPNIFRYYYTTVYSNTIHMNLMPFWNTGSTGISCELGKWWNAYNGWVHLPIRKKG